MLHEFCSPRCLGKPVLRGLLLAVFLAWTWGNAAEARPLQVEDMSLQVEGREERIVLTLSDPAYPSVFQLENPARLVIDLPPFQWRVSSERFRQYGGGLIRDIRYARFSERTSRIVLDLTQPVILLQDGTGSGAAKEVQLVIKSAGAGGEAVVGLPSKLPLAVKNMTPPSGRPEVFEELPTPLAKPPAMKPLIVIDAGHGGQDPGTVGRGGTREKNVTLLYARELQRALINSGKFRAELTRSGDYFILLRERIRIAKRKGASLFVSLHADSAPGTRARGLSIYTLSEDASDAEAAALAAQENKADVLAEVDLSHQDKDVAEILIDLAQRDTKNKSIELAENLIGALGEEVALLSNTHRFAGFAVLKAPDIPAVLLEIGFLSHPEEERLINSGHHRERVVRGIIRGITNYFAQAPSRE